MRTAPDIGFLPTVPVLIEQAVSRHGDAAYVVGGTDRLTFADADRRSAALARRLVAVGVGKGARVAMLYPSGTDFAVALLAIARIGAIAVLLSTTVKSPELATAAMAREVHPSDKLLMIWTSGSSAQPKGVVHTPAPLCARWHQRWAWPRACRVRAPYSSRCHCSGLAGRSVLWGRCTREQPSCVKDASTQRRRLG